MVAPGFPPGLRHRCEEQELLRFDKLDQGAEDVGVNYGGGVHRQGCAVAFCGGYVGCLWRGHRRAKCGIRIGYLRRQKLSWFGFVLRQNARKAHCGDNTITKSSRHIIIPFKSLANPVFDAVSRIKSKLELDLPSRIPFG